MDFYISLNAKVDNFFILYNLWWFVFPPILFMGEIERAAH